tara:strand:+ start:3084 stop:3773 length:690 start_codon:yes stop_codon:yes gene_type:complete
VDHREIWKKKFAGKGALDRNSEYVTNDTNSGRSVTNSDFSTFVISRPSYRTALPTTALYVGCFLVHFLANPELNLDLQGGLGNYAGNTNKARFSMAVAYLWASVGFPIMVAQYFNLRGKALRWSWILNLLAFTLLMGAAEDSARFPTLVMGLCLAISGAFIHLTFAPVANALGIVVLVWDLFVNHQPIWEVDPALLLSWISKSFAFPWGLLAGIGALILTSIAQWKERS